MSVADLDWNAAPQALGLLQLQDDPQYSRISADRHLALVEAALEDGRSLADLTRDRRGRDPASVAARCNVPVIHSDDDAGFGSTIVYADYATRPPCITLYVPAIARLDRLIAGRGARYPLGIGSTMPIFLAHELYHHFDCTCGSAPLSRRHRVQIFRIGLWNWTSGLASLSEIAAGAFAQHLLGLPFHPKLLDLLTHLSPARGHVSDEITRLRVAHPSIVSRPEWLRQRRVNDALSPPRAGGEGDMCVGVMRTSIDEPFT